MTATGVRPMSLRRAPGVAHIAACALLLAAGLFAYWRAIGFAVFDVDNLNVLTRAALPNPVDLLTQTSTSNESAFRPLAYLSVWIQYQLLGVAPKAFFTTNLLLLLGCGAALYLYVRRLTGSWLAGAAAGVLLVVDFRDTTVLEWVGARTIVMASLFGLAALFVVDAAPPRRATWWALFALLLAAALSKEPGLAFVPAVVLAGWLADRADRRQILYAAAGAAAAYAFLRVVVAGGATATYFCDSMGFFAKSRTVCYGHPPPGSGEVLSGGALLGQYAFNVVAAFVGQFVPTMRPDGVLQPAGSFNATQAVELVFWLLVSALAVVAWVARPRVTLPLLVVIAGNAVLSFVLYRDRNMLVGTVALYAAAAIGATVVAAAVARARPGGVVAVGLAAIAVVVPWTAWQAHRRDGEMHRWALRWSHAYPCPTAKAVSLTGPEGRVDIEPSVVRAIRRNYGLPPDC